jgi:uncharacterized delta-60 repeat protein
MRRFGTVTLMLFAFVVGFASTYSCGSGGGGGDDNGGGFTPATGILDDSFGGYAGSGSTRDGFVLFDGGNNNDYGLGVTTDLDGRVYVSGSYDNSGGNNDMAIWRFTSSGVLDSTFGGDAFTVDGIPDGFSVYDRGSYDTGYAVALDQAGHVYVAGHTHGGSSDYDMTIWRFNSDGVLDTAFGSNGIVMHNSAAGGGGPDSSVAMTLDQSGRAYVTGYSRDGSSVDHMTIWRYSSAGVLDTTFGGDTNPPDGIPDGFAIYNGGGGNYYGQAIAYDSAAGRVYAAGYRNASTQDLVLLCYDSAGVLDTAFSDDGIFIHDGATTGDDAAGLAVTLDPAGRIYVAGANQADSIVWRFNGDGVLDTTFGGDISPADGTPDGFVTHDDAAGGNGTDEARAITLDQSGLVYVTGNSYGTNEDAVLWRYTSSGFLDTIFGGDVNPADGNPDGFIVLSGTAGGDGNDRGTSVSVGGIDGNKVYVAGYSHSGSNNDMVLWRFR